MDYDFSNRDEYLYLLMSVAINLSAVYKKQGNNDMNQ